MQFFSAEILARIEEAIDIELVGDDTPVQPDLVPVGEALEQLVGGYVFFFPYQCHDFAVSRHLLSGVIL